MGDMIIEIKIRSDTTPKHVNADLWSALTCLGASVLHVSINMRPAVGVLDFDKMRLIEIKLKFENFILRLSTCLPIVYFRKMMDILKLIYDDKLGHLNKKMVFRFYKIPKIP